MQCGPGHVAQHLLNAGTHLLLLRLLLLWHSSPIKPLLVLLLLPLLCLACYCS
jgi:hypothetical protein